MTSSIPTQRISSIDFLRGLVMIIMVLDHVRDFFHQDAMLHDPLDLNTTTPWLFFTRWITHYCAPVFVLLSGISAYLSGLKKDRATHSWHLIKRGFILILIEVTIVTFGWSFNPYFHIFVFQVIWAIGASMVALGLLIRLPVRWVGLISLLILLSHNLLDGVEASPAYTRSIWSDLLHHGHFVMYPLFANHNLLIVYPLLPWIGIIGLGYAIGTWYHHSISPSTRKKRLLITGSSLLLLFVLLRMVNSYGDPHLRSPQPTFLFTILNGLDTTKYPPSLIFTCMTLGPAMLLLALTERMNNWLSRIIIRFGQVPFFFYVSHIYLIHLITLAAFFIHGYTTDQIITEGSPFWFRPPAFGFSLIWVWILWLVVVVLLYLPCKWYAAYKSSHRNLITTYF